MDSGNKSPTDFENVIFKSLASRVFLPNEAISTKILLMNTKMRKLFFLRFSLLKCTKISARFFNHVRQTGILERTNHRAGYWNPVNQTEVVWKMKQTSVLGQSKICQNIECKLCIVSCLGFGAFRGVIIKN